MANEFEKEVAVENTINKGDSKYCSKNPVIERIKCPLVTVKKFKEQSQQQIR